MGGYRRRIRRFRPVGVTSASSLAPTNEDTAAVESPEDYRHRLAEECPISVYPWKTAKALIYLSFVGAIVWLAITNGAPPTRIAAVGIVAALVVVIGEVREIQVANWLTIRFGRSHRSGEDEP